MNRVRMILIALVATVIFGCGGSGERGKNKDLDRPPGPTTGQSN